MKQDTPEPLSSFISSFLSFFSKRTSTSSFFFFFSLKLIHLYLVKSLMKPDTFTFLIYYSFFSSYFTKIVFLQMSSEVNQNSLKLQIYQTLKEVKLLMPVWKARVKQKPLSYVV